MAPLTSRFAERCTESAHVQCAGREAFVSSATIRDTRLKVVVSTRPMGGLKGEAIVRGAHPECMAAGRAAACDACLAIVDAIIDSKRRPPVR
jgi:hypothetical protein